MKRRLSTLICTAILASAEPGHAKFLYHGACKLKNDPAVSPPSLINICANANAGTWIIHKSKTPDGTQAPILDHASGSLSIFASPWISLSAKGHVNVLKTRDTYKTIYREQERDSVTLQFGNNALSRHRVHGGRGRPMYRLNHQQRENLEYAWGIASFDAPDVSFLTYTYDNQTDWTVQATYGQTPDTSLSAKQRLFGSGRLMYDIAALEGTRLVFGGYGDGKLKRAATAGILNINGKGDETALEVTRTFGLYPYDPAEFNQLIRLSYLSHEQSKSRYKFQYDDLFRKIRLGGFGVVYSPVKYTELEAHVGYGKHEDKPGLSHWFGYVHAGVYL